MHQEGIAVNNTWHSFRKDSEIAFVYVHGYFSNAKDCWKNDKVSTFWPELLSQDKRLPPLSIFLGGYYTGIDSTSYGIGDCANQLFGALQRESADGSPSVLSFKNIVFVCHSLGGIVTRYMLQAYQKHFADHKIGLLLMASPSIGSDYAVTFKRLINFYRNKLGQQLATDSEALTNLDDLFKLFLEGRSDQDLVGAEAVEHLGMFNMKWLPGFKPIVLKSSAARYFSEVRVIPGCDHSSIVKPTDLNHESHNFLVDFIVKKFMKIADLSGVKESLGGGHVGGEQSYARGALFDIYNKDCDKYYLVRSIDEQIKVDFSLSSIWVYGASGTGKTSAINRLMLKLDCKSISMCFSQCTGGGRDALIAEMIDSVYLCSDEIFTLPEKSYASLLRILMAKLRELGSLVLFIDEVPADDGSLGEELLILIEDLLTSVKQLNPTGFFSIVVSSLNKPGLSAVRNQEKLNQYLRLREFCVWGDEELEALVGLVLPFLPAHACEGIDIRELISQAGGSPRFLKTFFKNKIAQPGKSPIELFLVSAGGV